MRSPGWNVIALGIVGAAAACSGDNGSGSPSSSGAANNSSTNSANVSHSGSASTSTAAASGGNVGVTNDCTAVDPCGGSIVGTWKITKLCSNASANQTDMTCPAETETVTAQSIDGTITFNSDMTYSTTITAMTTISSVIPLSCFSDAGLDAGAAVCAGYNAGLSIADGGITGSCAVSGANCDCTEAFASGDMVTAGGGVTSGGGGTYTTSGNTVTTTPSGDIATTNSYCVQGNTLTVASIPPSDGGTPILQQIVATKQ